MKRVTLVSILLFAFVLSGLAIAAESMLLDGKTFTGQIGKQGETKGDADDFIFHDGMFRSTHCEKNGYKEGNYSSEKKGEMVSFTSETANTKGEKMSWNGTLKGNLIEGTAVNKGTDGKVVSTYWFKGSLK